MSHPLHFIAFVSLATSAFILFAVSLRIGSRGRRTLFNLSFLLAAFSGVHSLYHLAEYLSMIFLADVILLPLSAILFAIFALYYWRTSWRGKGIEIPEDGLIAS